MPFFMIFLFRLQNGSVMYTIYYMLYAVAMAGISSATIILIYDYVDKEKRTGALALKSTCCGFVGFITTPVVSPLVVHIQNGGNSLFGIDVYAQQVVSLVSASLLIVLIIYLNTTVRCLK